MNLRKKYKFVVFSDTHIPVEGNETVFDRFLETLEYSAQFSEITILLGDVFEVWSGVSYYNHKRGQILLEKIKELKKQSKFVLVEGNWDFFLCKKFWEHFSVCSEKYAVFNENGINFLFTHGHFFGDWQTRVLHFILTNPISYLAWTTGLLRKLEVKVAQRFLNKETNPLPKEYDLSLAAKKLKNKFKKSDFMFSGHFHKEKRIENVFFLKDYQSSGIFYGIAEENLDTLIFENGNFKVLNSLALQ